MPDRYGAQSIPLSAPGVPLAITPAADDPLLTYLGSYLQTVVNARLGALWASLAPGTPKPIAHVFDSEPVGTVFADRQLPALFLHRTGGGGFEDLASDIRVSVDTLSLLWVFPPATRDKQANRSSMATLFFRVLDIALKEGRDPSWRVAGDTDPAAATFGSSIATYAGFYSLRPQRWQRQDVTIQTDERTTPLVFPAWQLPLEVRERYARDAGREDELAGIDLTVTTSSAGDALTTAEIRLDK